MSEGGPCGKMQPSLPRTGKWAGVGIADEGRGGAAAGRIVPISVKTAVALAFFRVRGALIALQCPRK